MPCKSGWPYSVFGELSDCPITKGAAKILTNTKDSLVRALFFIGTSNFALILISKGTYPNVLKLRRNGQFFKKKLVTNCFKNTDIPYRQVIFRSNNNDKGYLN